MEWIVGIATGIISPLLSWLIVRRLWPFLVGLVQQVPRISGEWMVRYENNRDIVGKATVSQWGTSVKADVEITKNHQGEETNNKYLAQGKIVPSGVATLLWQDQELPGGVIGTFMLIYSSQTRRFTGKTTYLIQEENRIGDYEIYLSRR